MMKRLESAVDEAFLALQMFSEACLCLAAVGVCYGISRLCYYWPIIEAYS